MRAFEEAKKGKWNLVDRHARKIEDRLPKKALQWMRIIDPRGKTSFKEIVKFIADNPHWPKQTQLRRRAEESINDNTSKADIISWFQGRHPSTDVGAYHLVRILLENKRTTEAKLAARRAWVYIDMGYRIEKKFQKRYRKLLRKKDHIARLDRLLWKRRISASLRQLRRMTHDFQWLALARIALMRREPGVDYAVSKVPKHLIADPGLVYERVRWRRKKRLYDSAIKLLHQAPVPGAAAKKWWSERRILSRWLLRQDRADEAYRLSSTHRQTHGIGLAEGEWLSGWIALRWLHRYVDAFEHFKKMFDKVSYPVSKSRAAYWAGRAAAANGKTEIASQWFAVAAMHVTSFYGQLAAAKLPPAANPYFPSEPEPTTADKEAFAKSELVRLVKILAELNLRDEIDSFVRQLVRTAKTAPEWTMLADLARNHGRDDLAIYIAKRALRDRVVLSRLGYPDLHLALDTGLHPALVKALVRQESAFNPKAVSRAGALGLMQVMPKTAYRVARSLKIRYSRSRLTQDPKYNITIGQAYLVRLLEKYHGSPILALSAYNAGPARVKRWLRTLGDPNQSVEHAVDWIEGIPFYETRNYVQRVLENFTVYRGHGKEYDLSLSLETAIAPFSRQAIP